jgi:hypothetical protein
MGEKKAEGEIMGFNCPAIPYNEIYRLQRYMASVSKRFFEISITLQSFSFEGEQSNIAY